MISIVMLFNFAQPCQDFLFFFFQNYYGFKRKAGKNIKVDICVYMLHSLSPEVNCLQS